MNASSTVEQHGERITKVETSLELLTVNVDKLAKAVEAGESLARADHLETQREIRELGRQFQSIGKANVPLYLTSVVVIMAIVGAILFWPLQQISQLRTESDVARSERKQSAIDRAVLQERTANVDAYNKNENTWIRSVADIKLDAANAQRKLADEYIQKIHENDFKWQQRIEEMTHDDLRTRLDRMEKRAKEKEVPPTE